MGRGRRAAEGRLRPRDPRRRRDWPCPESPQRSRPPARTSISPAGTSRRSFPLRRDGAPVVLRNLLAECRRAGRRSRPRVGRRPAAPLPPVTRRSVRATIDALSHGTRVRCALDARERPLHCHHEKIVVVDDRVAFVGGIDLTDQSGDRFDGSSHASRAQRRVARRVRQARGPRRRRRRSALPDAMARGHRRGSPFSRLSDAAGPAGTYDRPDRAHRPGACLRRGAGRRLRDPRVVRPGSRVRDLPRLSREPVPLVAGDRTRSCGRSSSAHRRPASASWSCCLRQPSSGSDDTRGTLAELIEADDGAGRILACTLYARHGALADPVYVHAKIGIVDDRWLTVGSANLNEHSLFNDTEMNVVCRRPHAGAGDAAAPLGRAPRARPREYRGRSWTRSSTGSGGPSPRSSCGAVTTAVPLTHRLVLLPNVSRRSERLLGPLQGLLVDG